LAGGGKRKSESILSVHLKMPMQLDPYHPFMGSVDSYSIHGKERQPREAVRSLFALPNAEICPNVGEVAKFV